jgi:hypothetical protein
VKLENPIDFQSVGFIKNFSTIRTTPLCGLLTSNEQVFEKKVAGISG